MLDAQLFLQPHLTENIPCLCVECWIFVGLNAYFAENRDMTHSVTPRVLGKADIVHVVNRIKKGKNCPVS